MITTGQLVVLLIAWSDATVISNVTTTFPGDNSVISCSNNGQLSSDFQIEFTPAGSNNPVILFSQSLKELNPNFAHQYNVSGDSAAFELTILNASPNHAGKYACDWRYRSQETELVVLAPSAPTCKSTILRDDESETEVRFECSVGFHGNVLPTVEFWMVTDNIKLGPITAPAPAQREHNTSKTTLIQTISSVSGDIKYACQLPDINKAGILSRSYCSFEKNRQSGKNVESTGNHVAVIIAVVALAIIVLIALLLKIIFRLRKQLKKKTRSDRRYLIPKSKRDSTTDKPETDAPVFESSAIQPQTNLKQTLQCSSYERR